MSIKSGVSRIVLLIGRYAIKIPRCNRGDDFFVLGMQGNILERERWRASKRDYPNGHPALAPIYFCFPFGLLLIMKRYRMMLDRPLTREEIAALPFINVDNNGNNAALDEQGRIVIIDYGNCDMHYVSTQTFTEPA